VDFYLVYKVEHSWCNFLVAKLELGDLEFIKANSRLTSIFPFTSRNYSSDCCRDETTVDFLHMHGALFCFFTN
jgi:hypothetical protein